MAEKGGTKILGVITICIMLFTIGFSGCVEDDENEDNWGEKGELSLKISLDKNLMTINESIIVTCILINSGDTDLRIIYPFAAPWIIDIYDENNSHVDFLINFYPPPPPSNNDLHKLKSKENVTFTYRINKYNWDIEENKTYRIIGHYISPYHKDYTLPYWKGEIWSNEHHFIVKN
jgi:hypothetical protein